MPKPFDIVVYGASGFTGRLCVKYLLSSESAKGVKFAAGGRSKAKIQGVLSELGAPDLPILIADSDDEDALRKLVQQTSCVITTVGPYTLYGSTLVKVCAENGVHCLDLTGEPLWVHNMKRLHEDAAQRTKAIILHNSGVDSIPSDLNTYLAVKKLQTATKVPCGLVTSAWKGKGEASGGTFATALVTSDDLQDKGNRRVFMNPYCLSPVKGKARSQLTWWYRDGPKRIGAFFFMEPVNSKIVYQTWGTLEEKAKSDKKAFHYGPDFEYREYAQVPNRVIAFLVSLVFYSMSAILASSKVIRRLAAKYGIQSGQGPSEEVQNKGYFKTVTTARSIDEKTFAQVSMYGSGDPGYKATSALLCESALGIVQDYERLTDIAKEGGNLTPALVFGEHLRTRLEKTGQFKFEERFVQEP